MDEYGLAYNFASGWDGANTNLKQYENLLAGSPEYTADGSAGIGLNLFGEDNKLRFEDYFSTKNALSGSAAGPTKESAELINNIMPNNQVPNSALIDSSYLGQTPEYWQKFGAAGGVVGDNSVAGQALANQVSQDNTLMGMNPEQWGSALKMGQIGIGAGQLGLGLAGYFENKKTADKQRELLGQQIESNRAEIDARKNYRSALEGFGLK